MHRLYLALVGMILAQAVMSADHAGSRETGGAAPVGHVYEVSSQSPGPAPSSVRGRLLDPRWYCENSKIGQPRLKVATELADTDAWASYRRSLPSDKTLQSMLGEMLALPLERAFGSADELNRELLEERSIVARFSLYLCLENPSALCAYYADTMVGALGAESPAAKTACDLMRAYALAGESELKERYEPFCSQPANVMGVSGRLSALVNLALSTNPLEKDRYLRLILGMPSDRRMAVLQSFENFFGETLSECDLMRPTTWLSKEPVLAAIVQDPLLRGHAVSELNRNPARLTVNMEQALLLHLAASAGQGLLKALSSPVREKVEGLSNVLKRLPQPPQNGFQRHPYPPSPSAERALFRPVSSAADIITQLQSREWRCYPQLVTPRMVALQRMENDVPLKQSVDDLYWGTLLKEAAIVFEALTKGTLSSLEAVAELDDLQSQLPHDHPSRGTLRELISYVAPVEFQQALADVYAGRFTPAMVAAFEDTGLQRRLYLQLLLQLSSGVQRAAPKLLNHCALFSYSDDDLDRLSEMGVLGALVLLRTAKSVHFRIRMSAVETIGSRGAEEAHITVPALIQVLRYDPQYPVKHAAAQALGAIGDPAAVPALIDSLTDPDCYFVKGTAAEAFGANADPAEVPAIIETLAHDARYDVRNAAAEALGKIGDSAATSALIDALKDCDGNVRGAAIKALGIIGDPAVIPLVIEILRQDAKSQTRGIAALALGTIGDKAATSALIDALKDSDGGVRRAAAKALGIIGDKEAVAALIDSLNDSYASVCNLAAQALGNIGDPAAVPALIDVFRDSDSFVVRCVAAEALGKIGDPAAIGALIAVLTQSDSYYVRGVTAKALGAIGDSAAVPALIDALKDSDLSVCHAAAQALGNIGDPAAVPALTEALGNWRLRVAAEAALARIGH